MPLSLFAILGIWALFIHHHSSVALPSAVIRSFEATHPLDIPSLKFCHPPPPLLSAALILSHLHFRLYVYVTVSHVPVSSDSLCLSQSHLQCSGLQDVCLLPHTGSSPHICFLLTSVSFHIDFKVLLIVFKALRGLTPHYISEMLLPYEPGRPLRSSGSSLLTVPRSITETFGDAAFSHYAPKLWNSLPEDQSQTLTPSNVG